MADVFVPRTSGGRGVAVRVRCSTWHLPRPAPLRAGTVSMETAGCSAGSSACGAAGAGRGNQRASRPWRALEKAPSVIAETGLKNVINLRHSGQRRSSQESPSALASCRCDAATSTCFLLPCPCVLFQGLRKSGEGSVQAEPLLTCRKQAWLLCNNNPKKDVDTEFHGP